MSSRRPRIRLEGDHGKVHAGCRAVWSVLSDWAASQGELAPRGSPYDILVVNGEGSMHHDTRTYRRKMALLAEALDRGKRAWLVNSVWQDNPPEAGAMLRRLEGVRVRETMSRAALAEIGISATAAPDLSYFAALSEPTSEATDFTGAVAVTDFHAPQLGHFVRATSGPMAKAPFFDLGAQNWSDGVSSLRTASAVVTGRHHVVYAACRARIPFVPIAGNTHKIEGLFRSAGVTIPMFEPRDALTDGIAWARDHGEVYAALFAWLDGFTLADALPELSGS